MDNMSGWNSESEQTNAPMSMTIVEFEGICQSLRDQRAVVDQAKEAYELEVRKADDIEAKILECLEQMGRTNYKSKVGTVSITHRTSFKLPGSPEEKEAYFNYLREKDMYDSMISVNSSKHNSFCKAELELAEAEGRGLDFKIPGVAEPTINKTLSFRKA